MKRLRPLQGPLFLMLLDALYLTAPQNYAPTLVSALGILQRRRHLRRPRRRLRPSSLSQPSPPNQSTLLLTPVLLSTKLLLPTKLLVSRPQRQNFILLRRCAPRPILKFQMRFLRNSSLRKRNLSLRKRNLSPRKKNSSLRKRNSSLRKLRNSSLSKVFLPRGNLQRHCLLLVGPMTRV